MTLTRARELFHNHGHPAQVLGDKLIVRDTVIEFQGDVALVPIGELLMIFDGLYGKGTA